MTRPDRPAGTTCTQEVVSLTIGVLVVLMVWATILGNGGFTAGRAWVALVLALGIIGFTAMTGIHRCFRHRR